MYKYKKKKVNTHKKQNEVTRWTSAKEKKTGNKTKNKTKQNERTKNNQKKKNKLTDKKEGRKNGKESQEGLTQVKKKIQKQKKKKHCRKFKKPQTNRPKEYNNDNIHRKKLSVSLLC